MAIFFDEDEVARDFVLEYLQRSPDFGDVGEFMDDHVDEYDDDDVAKVYNSAVAYLDTIYQRFEDSEN